MKARYLLPKLLDRLGLLPYTNIVETMQLNGKALRVPILRRTGYMTLYMPEMWMIRLLEHFLPLQKGMFVDVGVNLGQTMLKLRSVDTDIAYIGFEPNPNCLAYTHQLIAANAFRNTTLIPVGLAATTQVLELNLFEDNDSDGTASITTDIRPDKVVHKKIHVPVFAFEQVQHFLTENIAILKIDVEGAEWEVLQTMKAAIVAQRPIILIEILTVYAAQNAFIREQQTNIEHFTEENSYQICRVQKDEQDGFVALTPLSVIGAHSDPRGCDYALLPKELVGEVAHLFTVNN